MMIFRYLIKLIITLSFLSAEVFEGYTLFSPTGGGPGGGTGGTSYLLNNNMDIKIIEIIKKLTVFVFMIITSNVSL